MLGVFRRIWAYDGRTAWRARPLRRFRYDGVRYAVVASRGYLDGTPLPEGSVLLVAVGVAMPIFACTDWTVGGIKEELRREDAVAERTLRELLEAEISRRHLKVLNPRFGVPALEKLVLRVQRRTVL